MLDLMKRVCLNPLDYCGMCRRQKIYLKEIRQEATGIYSFIFSAPELPKWKAGQHAIFSFGKMENDRGWRPFSVASSTDEKEIRIGTTIPDSPSPFKQKLLSLKSGDSITMYGPFGEFFVGKKTKQVVGVAGGIGITPFRSIVSDLANKHKSVKLTLIYSSADFYTYKDELENWISKNPNLNIIYTKTADEVNSELNKLVKQHNNNATYFIAGSPGMIGALRKTLKQKGIKKIVNDPFKGY